MLKHPVYVDGWPVRVGDRVQGRSVPLAGWVASVQRGGVLVLVETVDGAMGSGPVVQVEDVELVERGGGGDGQPVVSGWSAADVVAHVTVGVLTMLMVVMMVAAAWRVVVWGFDV